MKFKNFLLPLIGLVFSGCSDVLINDSPGKDIRVDDFEETRAVVNEWYPYFEFKKINWDSISQAYYPEIIQSRSDQYLMVIDRMLEELKDGHVRLILRNKAELGYRTPRQLKDDKTYDFAITEKYITGKITTLADGKIKYGMISNLGYIRISSFSGNMDIKIFNKVFNDLDGTEGLIIDVRHNGGGSTQIAGYVVAKCLQEPLQTPGWMEKGVFHKGPVIQPDWENNYAKPVVLLVNGKSFSATEHFVMWMQQIDHVILTGDTTGGGAGNPLLFSLPSGNAIRVSTRFFFKYDDEPIEWNGIVPDSLILQTEADLANGEDNQLEFAIEFLESK